MKISIIVAASANNVIGVGGGLPWHLPEDLKRFKEVTMGKPMIMGRATYDSIGRALPGRTSIVVTRQADFEAEGCIVVDSIDAARDRCRELGIFIALRYFVTVLRATVMPRLANQPWFISST